jgi:hypothetical protein
VKRSPFSVAGVLVPLAGLASSSAQAQPFTITKPVPSNVAPTSTPATGRPGNLGPRATTSGFNVPTLVATDWDKGATYVVDVINASVRVIISGRVETFAANLPALTFATGMTIDPSNETLIFTLRGESKRYMLRRGGQWLEPLDALEVLPHVTFPAHLASPTASFAMRTSSAQVA